MDGEQSSPVFKDPHSMKTNYLNRAQLQLESPKRLHCTLKDVDCRQFVSKNCCKWEKSRRHMKNDYTFSTPRHIVRHETSSSCGACSQLIKMIHESQTAINPLSKWNVMCFMKFFRWQLFKWDFYEGVELRLFNFFDRKRNILIDKQSKAIRCAAINQKTPKGSSVDLNSGVVFGATSLEMESSIFNHDLT